MLIGDLMNWWLQVKRCDLVRLKYRRKDQVWIGLAIEVNEVSVRVLWSNSVITYCNKIALEVLSENM